MIAAFMVIAQLTAANITYQEARSMVGRHESQLSTGQGNKLYEIQEFAMNDAVPKCVAATPPNQALKVSLVLAIGETGKAVSSRVKEEGDFANCMKNELMAKEYIVPPRQPFYTSFDLDLSLGKPE